MQNQIQVFEHNEFGKLEIITIGGKPYFPAKECAEKLGYAKSRNAINQHCKGALKQGVLTNGGIQEKTFIPEGDLYRLIIRSKLPAATVFEAWVCDDVLPSIRKHGAYIADNALDQLIENPEAAMKFFETLKAERGEKEKLENHIKQIAPKARYYDIILQCPGAVQVSIIAKDYGYSAVKFNKLLHALGLQYKIGRTWLLYQNFADKGYTVTKTYDIKGKPTAAILTCFTQRGRFWLYNVLKSNGLLPLTERNAET